MSIPPKKVVPRRLRPPSNTRDVVDLVAVSRTATRLDLGGVQPPPGITDRDTRRDLTPVPAEARPGSEPAYHRDPRPHRAVTMSSSMIDEAMWSAFLRGFRCSGEGFHGETRAATAPAVLRSLRSEFDRWRATQRDQG